MDQAFFTGGRKLLIDPRTDMKLSPKCLRWIKMNTVNPSWQFMHLGL